MAAHSGSIFPPSFPFFFFFLAPPYGARWQRASWAAPGALRPRAGRQTAGRSGYGRAWRPPRDLPGSGRAGARLGPRKPGDVRGLPGALWGRGQDGEPFDCLTRRTGGCQPRVCIPHRRLAHFPGETRVWVAWFSLSSRARDGLGRYFGLFFEDPCSATALDPRRHLRDSGSAVRSGLGNWPWDPSVTASGRKRSETTLVWGVGGAH